MSIDILTEQPMSLDDAAKLFPLAGNGKPVHPRTVRLWATRGLRGIRLETVFCGCRRMTTREAILRFVADYTEAREERFDIQPGRIRPDRHQAAVRARLAAVHGID